MVILLVWGSFYYIRFPHQYQHPGHPTSVVSPMLSASIPLPHLFQFPPAPSSLPECIPFHLPKEIHASIRPSLIDSLSGCVNCSKIITCFTVNIHLQVSEYIPWFFLGYLTQDDFFLVPSVCLQTSIFKAAEEMYNIIFIHSFFFFRGIKRPWYSILWVTVGSAGTGKSWNGMIRKSSGSLKA